MRLIQCFPLYNARGLRRLIQYAKRAGADILLDLEDSICDVSNAERTNIYKANARQTLSELSDLLITLPDVHIRINSISSPHFADDLICLEALSQIRWQSILLPKAESAEEVQQTAAHLASHSIRYSHLSPIIETAAGYDHFVKHPWTIKPLPVIVVYFGNYDYNLSRGTYPMTEQYDEAYWETITPLISKIEENGLHFGNSPYANLDDTDTFRYLLTRLHKICKLEPWQVSLSLKQTKVINAFNQKPATVISDADEARIPLHAHNPVPFRSKTGRSFAYDHVTNKITTPHEFILQQKHNTP